MRCGAFIRSQAMHSTGPMASVKIDGSGHARRAVIITNILQTHLDTFQKI